MAKLFSLLKPPKQKKCIAIFSFARSGTNYLSDLLNGFEDFRSYREIFQLKGVHLYNKNTLGQELTDTLREVERTFGLGNCKVRDPALIKAVHANPQAMLNILSKGDTFSSRPYYAFKIFEGHLPEKTIVRAILRNSTIVPIVFKRNPLDTFISAAKVQLVEKAVSVDTTEVRPSLNFKKFCAWREKRERWIDFINKNAGKFAGVIGYDELMCIESDKDRLKVIRDVLEGHSVNLRLSSDAHLGKTTNKQDRSSSPEDKVSNFVEFLKECADQGIDPREEPRPLFVPRLID